MGSIHTKPIRFHNRYTHELETEAVYGERWLCWAYGNPLGRLTTHLLLQRAWFSRWYGWRMDRPKSKAKIGPFIERYGVDMSIAEKAPEAFGSFNDFFIRTLKPEARPIAEADVVFPADGRHLGFQDVSEAKAIFVKGQRWDLAQLLGDAALAERYAKGSLVLSRLCPVDYHRFHFPVAGTPGNSRLFKGGLKSVNPIALRQNIRILGENKRMLTEIATEELGTVLMLEIGATCVGSMTQSYQAGAHVEKGAEKGYFSFGGSSTLLLFEPGRVQLAEDLVKTTAHGYELYARMGDALAIAQ